MQYLYLQCQEAVIKSIHSLIKSSLPKYLTFILPTFVFVASMSFLQLNHSPIMAAKDTTTTQEQSNPWVETPLRESYALSEAAGWYGHTLPLFPSPCCRSDIQPPS